MCGRITLTTPDVHAVAAALEAQVTPEAARLYKPRYNAAPTDTHFVVTRERLLVPAVWGFAGGGRATASPAPGRRPQAGALVINARSEKGLKGAPVIVAADGFYEWSGPARARQPVWFRPRGGGLLYLAGAAERLPDGRLAFVVLTTEAEGLVARIHDRMPLMLARDAIARFLAGEIPAAVCDLTATEVSAKVNDVRNDDPSLLEPPRQLSLL